MNDETNRFLGPPQMLRPSGVSDTEWRDRRTLPSVHTVGTYNSLTFILPLSRPHLSPNPFAIRDYLHTTRTPPHPQPSSKEIQL